MDLKFDHLNLTVNDIQKSIDWYGQVFGFELVEKGISTEGRNWAIIARNDNMVCMTEFPNRKSADSDDGERYHQIYHFGVRVVDAAEWEARVKRYGLQLYYGGVNEYPFSRSWYVRDPSGHTIEVSHSNGEPLKFPKLNQENLT